MDSVLSGCGIITAGGYRLGSYRERMGYVCPIKGNPEYDTVELPLPNEFTRYESAELLCGEVKEKHRKYRMFPHEGLWVVLDDGFKYEHGYRIARVEHLPTTLMVKGFADMERLFNDPSYCGEQYKIRLYRDYRGRNILVAIGVYYLGELKCSNLEHKDLDLRD